MTEARKLSLHPNSEILCEIYNSMLDNGDVVFPLGDIHIKGLDSTVKTIEANYYGTERFKTYEEKAAAYFYFIIKDHNLTDGNKRLAVIWLKAYCKAKSIELTNNETLDKIAVSIEDDKSSIQDQIPLIVNILFKKQKAA